MVAQKRKKQFANLVVAGCAFLTFFMALGKAGTVLLAQEVTPSPQTDTGSEQINGADPTLMSQEAVSQEIDLRVEKRTEFLNTIKQQLQDARSDYSNIGHNVDDTKSKLVDVEGQVNNLQTQLDNLTGQIVNTVAQMNNVIKQIEGKQAQIDVMDNEIAIKKLEIENQKKMLAEYLDVMYEQQNSVSDTTGLNNEINIAKMVLADKPPEEALREIRYFNVLEDTGHQIFDKLQQLVNEQQSNQIQLENARNRLEMLYRTLGEEQQTLQVQQQAKTQLLQETQGQQQIYQQLLDESIQEQSQVLLDINSLRDNLQFIQNKINELGDKFNPDDFKSIIDKNTTSVYEFMKSTKDGDFTPNWPVSPSRGISAYFHDESYRRAMGMVHQAIDIRTPQGTPIHAPANGVVYKTRDNGYGYSYIILAHAGGFMTVYGHVSEIRVQEGEKILEGQVIGLSGATPGSKGAGLMTTGPHLHFEVLKGGKHVDPLDYLQLTYLPLDSLPEKYLSRVTGDPTRVSRLGNDSPTAETSQELLKMVEASGQTEAGSSS